MINYEKLKQREAQRYKDGYYSRENKLIRHNKITKSNEEEAKKQSNPRIASSCLNNDWD
jgi:hypothetical protein